MHYSEPEKVEDPLTRLLLRAVPPDEKGWKTLTNLSGRIGVSRPGIRKWIVKGRIPPNRAVQIVDIAEGRVSLHDFSPFVYAMPD